MKRVLLVLLVSLALSFSPVFADYFEVVTKDNEVIDIEQVQIKKTGSVQAVDILTLAYVNTQIAVLRAEIADLEARLVEMEALKAQITTLAEAVKLKAEEIE